MAGILKSTKNRFLIGKRIKEVEVPGTDLDTELFLSDAEIVSTGNSTMFLAELVILPTLAKNELTTTMVSGRFSEGKVYGMNGDTKSIEEYNFSRESSGTRINNGGIIQLLNPNNVRVDYDINTRALKGMLFEKASTNLIPYSGMGNYGSFAAVYGSDRSRCNVVTESGRTCIKVSNTSSQVFRLNTVPIDSTKKYTYSFWIKASQEFSVSLRHWNGAYYSWETKSVTTSWARMVKTFVPENGSVSDTLHLFVTPTGIIPEFFIADIQLEEGDTATSYIPTESGAVTRLADIMKSERPIAVYPKNSFYLNSDSYTGWFGDGVKDIDAAGINIFDPKYFVQNAVNSGVSGVQVVNFSVKSNEKYVLSTNMPDRSGLFDIFFYLGNDTPSSPVNGVGLMKPRSVTSLSDGIVKVGIRTTVIPDLLSGVYYIKLEKGDTPTAAAEALVHIDESGVITVSSSESDHLRSLSLVPRALKQEEI
ncbi:phage head spike fiber domain-containing protein [Sphingobacterium thalpophilum]|uniref:phage head spike fiber domain-containing protein n=1 Tax=Sphingobacterium thalpophilum TaxID=259 RepID=UPI003D955A84